MEKTRSDDADWIDVPIADFANKSYAAKRAARYFRRDGGATAVPVPPGIRSAGGAYASSTLLDHGTNHFVVGDAAGNVVSITNTVNQ